MLKNLKSAMPNLYIVIVAISISLWFEGLGILIRHCITGKDVPSGLLMCGIAISVFLMDDGNLTELYNYTPTNDKLTRHAPAVVAARRFD